MSTQRSDARMWSRVCDSLLETTMQTPGSTAPAQPLPQSITTDQAFPEAVTPGSNPIDNGTLLANGTVPVVRAVVTLTAYSQSTFTTSVQQQVTLPCHAVNILWTAQYIGWLLIKLAPKGADFAFSLVFLERTRRKPPAAYSLRSSAPSILHPQCSNKHCVIAELMTGYEQA